jgi:hypothetical protein
VLQFSLRYGCLHPSLCRFEMQSRKSAIDFFARSRIFRSSEIRCSGPARIIMISTYPLMAVRSSTSLRTISLVRRNSLTSSFRNASHLWSRLPCSVTSNLPLSKFNLILPVALDPYFSFRIGRGRDAHSAPRRRRSLPHSRLEVISPAVAARQKQRRRTSAIAAARAEKPTTRVRSIG